MAEQSRSRTNSVASSSSLEIISEEELREDLVGLDQSEQNTTRLSPEQSILEDLENAAKGITTSHFNPQQVVFLGVQDAYSFPLTVRFESKGDEVHAGDIIGIFKTPFLNIEDCVLAANCITDNKMEGCTIFTSSDLIDKEFYQFQFIRKSSQQEAEFKICGASVPWQFQPSIPKSSSALDQEQNTATSSTATWDMQKFDTMENQVWSEGMTSRLTEMCLAEQMKSFLDNLDISIQRSFLISFLDPHKLTDNHQPRCCENFDKLGRVFKMLSNMKVDAGKMKFNELLTQVVSYAKADWTVEKGVKELFCSKTGEMGCKCPIYEKILDSTSCLSLNKTEDVLLACNQEKKLPESKAMEEQLTSLKEENEVLKSRLDSLDSSILVLKSEKQSAFDSLQIFSEERSKFERDMNGRLVKESAKACQNHLEKERIQGELNLVKKSLDDSIKEKATLYSKLESELDQRKFLISKIEDLQTVADKLKDDKDQLLLTNTTLKTELDNMSQMLDAAQKSKEAAALLTSESKQVCDSQTQKSDCETQNCEPTSDSVSWIKCDSLAPESVDGDLVKVFSSLGNQLDLAKKRIQELETELDEYKKMALTNDVENEEHNANSSACPSVSTKASNTSVDKLNEVDKTTDIEAKLMAKMNTLEQNYIKSNASLEAKTAELESVQQQLRRFMDDNVETMSQRLSELAEESKSYDLKLAKLESCANSDMGWTDRESMISSRTSLASSTNSNMNSIKISTHLSGSGEAGKSSLPDPLVPDRLDTDPGIPELRKREPNKYSISNSDPAGDKDWIEKESGNCMFCQQFVVLDENHICGRETEGSATHKKQKELLKKDVPFCPVCSKVFAKDKQELLEQHVALHFQNETGESFFDLGID